MYLREGKLRRGRVKWLVVLDPGEEGGRRMEGSALHCEPG